jgi:hypothetical protein
MKKAPFLGAFLFASEISVGANLFAKDLPGDGDTPDVPAIRE